MEFFERKKVLKEKFFIKLSLTTFSLLLLQLQAVANEGVLMFSNQNIDLGLVSHEVTYHIVIPFKNIGKQEVQLLKIDTDCGCSKASFSQSNIAPGDSATISVDFKPTEGESPFYRSIILLTNGKISQYTISLQGVVAHAAEGILVNKEYITPWKYKKNAVPLLSKYALKIEGKKGETISYPLYVTNLGEKPLVLNQFDTKGKAETMQYPRMVQQGEVLMIPLQIKLTESGVFRDYYKLITDEKNILIRLQTIVN
ncbi:DUF1573 domain-containing protein [Flammeovirga sp. SJP92]|uniref:DUF1573 domain-containing protein n=1 Tax=Flammeovirga sp. SJP92 TaxID=1775430 RepID=UPI0007879F19|nr:DUF1573 domain-containing protein [Flammeovirga sp. SJP92]KXX69730.1 hypothetical protein AVL50_12620 [Flammeovirga sp. SJP92]